MSANALQPMSHENGPAPLVEGYDLYYSWSITGNGTIDGADDEASVSVDAGDAGTFTLTVDYSDDNGNSGSCSEIVTVVGVDSVDGAGGQIIVSTSDTLEFTAVPDPADAEFECLEWEYCYRAPGQWGWTGWTSLGSSDPIVTVDQSWAMGEYAFRVRNGSGDTWQSPSGTAEVVPFVNYLDISFGNAVLCQGSGDHVDLTAYPYPDWGILEHLHWQMRYYDPWAEEWDDWTDISWMGTSGDTITVDSSWTLGKYEFRCQNTEIAFPNWCAYSVTICVVKVDSLTADQGSAPDGPTNYVCWAASGVVTVTATLTPDITNNLPSCYSLTGGNVQDDKLHTTVDLSTPDITTIIATAGTSSATNVVVVWQAAVQGVTFGGAKFHAVYQDNGSGAYPVPQWTATANYPVAYTRGSTGAVTVTFSVAPAMITNVLIRGDGSSGVNLASTNCPVIGGTGTLTGAILDGPFPNQVDFFDPMVISWKASADGGTTFCDAGASTNQVRPLQNSFERVI